MCWLRCNLILLLCLSNSAYSQSLIDTESYQSLTSDRRSFLVGHPIVILVVESTSAQSTAGTNVSNALNFQANSFDNVTRNSLGIGANSRDEGNGKTVRNGTATTRLSAVITEILPNGMIRIEGQHNLLVNDENQKVIISGVAKIDDISKDNILVSNRIANAFIEIQGVGVINDAQRQGLIGKIMSWLGLL